MDISNYVEQLGIFKDIKFVAEDHSYLINNSRAKSVTSILKNLVKPFDSDYWAEVKANELGVGVEDLKAKWEFNAKLSQIKGTITHAILESKLVKTEFIYPQELIMNQFGYDPVQDLLQGIIPLIDKFLIDIDGKMSPVVSEFVIGDKDYMVGGTLDQIFYNHKSNKLEIWDWKTNKQIKTTSRYYHLSPIEDIPDTELDHYSLQLCLYKHIIQKNTGLELGDNYIVWFNELNSNYEIFRAKNYEEEINLILSKTT